MQFNRVSTCGLVFGKALDRIAIAIWIKFDQCRFICRIRRNRLGHAAAIMRLPGMAVFGHLVPAEHLIVMFRMAAANLRIIARAPHITFNPQRLLPKLVDQAPNARSKRSSMLACSGRRRWGWVWYSSKMEPIRACHWRSVSSFASVTSRRSAALGPNHKNTYGQSARAAGDPWLGAQDQKRMPLGISGAGRGKGAGSQGWGVHLKWTLPKSENPEIAAAHHARK